MKKILNFLSELSRNNNREWFVENKNEYELARKEFEHICNSLIIELSEFDNDIKNVDLRECMFRIYRDIRFTNDKTPYKTHFGAYIAYPGGRKSRRGGYYLHLDPKGSFFSAGIWCPQPNVLKALRQAIVDNYEEFQELRNASGFKEYFGDSFYEEDKLKTLPAGFPKDFAEPELLKLKHYLVSHPFENEELHSVNFVKNTAAIGKQAFPFLQFFNYTIDEMK